MFQITAAEAWFQTDCISIGKVASGHSRATDTTEASVGTNVDDTNRLSVTVLETRMLRTIAADAHFPKRAFP